MYFLNKMFLFTGCLERSRKETQPPGCKLNIKDINRILCTVCNDCLSVSMLALAALRQDEENLNPFILGKRFTVFFCLST